MSATLLAAALTFGAADHVATLIFQHLCRLFLSYLPSTQPLCDLHCFAHMLDSCFSFLPFMYPVLLCLPSQPQPDGWSARLHPWLLHFFHFRSRALTPPSPGFTALISSYLFQQQQQERGKKKVQIYPWHPAQCESTSSNFAPTTPSLPILPPPPPPLCTVSPSSVAATRPGRTQRATSAATVPR